MTESRAIDSIDVGGRFRKDLGDLSDLSASIEAVGLLHPVVVLPDGNLVAGARRLEACRRLGWEEIPVTVAENMDSARTLLEAERDENTCRLDMKPSERVALGRALEELERPAAKEREKAGKAPGVNVTQGKTRDIVGRAVGWSGVTYQRAKAVVVAAETGDPAAAHALEQMDESGSVRGAYKKVYPKHVEKRPRKPNGFEVYQPETSRQKQLANKAYERMGMMVSTLDGYRFSLEGFDVSRALAVAEDDEVERWIETLAGTIRSLNGLKRALRKQQEES